MSTEVKRELVAQLAAGDHPERAIPWLVGLVADDPYDEASHRDLVAALARAGRHGEARRYHRSYASRMQELGADATPLEVLTAS